MENYIERMEALNKIMESNEYQNNFVKACGVMQALIFDIMNISDKEYNKRLKSLKKMISIR